MSSPIAIRRAMDGPLWTVEQADLCVQLWGPSSTRSGWRCCWTTWDTDGNIIGTGFKRATEFHEVPSVEMPREIQSAVGAVLSAASFWRPGERCDHVRAQSFKELPDDQRECGYCGQAFTPERELS